MRTRNRQSGEEGDSAGYGDLKENSGFLGGSEGKESACQCRRTRFDSRVRGVPWRRKWQPTPVFLSGEFHGQMSLVGYSLWCHKQSDVIERRTLKKTL